MKFVIIRRTSLDRVDGVNVFILELADALIRSGHKVTLLGGHSSYKERDLIALFDVEHTPSIVSLLSKDLTHERVVKLSAWLSKGLVAIGSLRPDAIIVNGVLPFKTLCPLIAVNHAIVPKTHSTIQRFFTTLFYNKMADKIVAVSNQLKRELSSLFKVKPQRIHVIPPLINIEKYTPLPLSHRERSFIHVGTRVDIKNLVTTLRAFKLVSEWVHDVELYVCGPVNKDISKIVNNDKGKIHYLGWVPRREIRNLLRKVRVLCLPSIYEGLPYSVLEAFTSGTPVVASNAVPPELLVNHVNGYRIKDPYDYKSFAKRMTDLLVNDDEWSILAENARFTACGYDSDMIAKKYLALLSNYS